MDDKPEWRMHGQTIMLTLPLTDSVSVIKAKLHEYVGIPPGKQKLSCDVSEPKSYKVQLVLKVLIVWFTFENFF